MLARMTAHPLENIPASFPSGLRWYAFYTHARAEKKAEQAIAELGYAVFVPFEKKIRRKPGRKPMQYNAPYFPRYGFVRMDINKPEWGAIKEADGVTDLVRTASIPRSVPDAIIDTLRLMQNMGVLDATKPFKAEMEVEITDGPFRDLIGRVRRARSGDRADVLIKGLFGADRVVDVPLAYLRER